MEVPAHVVNDPVARVEVSAQPAMSIATADSLHFVIVRTTLPWPRTQRLIRTSARAVPPYDPVDQKRQLARQRQIGAITASYAPGGRVCAQDPAFRADQRTRMDVVLVVGRSWTDEKRPIMRSDKRQSTDEKGTR